MRGTRKREMGETHHSFCTLIMPPTTQFFYLKCTLYMYNSVMDDHAIMHFFHTTNTNNSRPSIAPAGPASATIYPIKTSVLPVHKNSE